MAVLRVPAPGIPGRGLRWHQSHPDVCEQVLARIRAEGPLTATELGGAKNGGPWWDWSDTKIAVEWLLDTGDVICARRTGWRRVYDLPERVLPAELLSADLTDDECVTSLAAVAGRALGVVTQADLADYQRLRYGGAGIRQDGRALSAAGRPPLPGSCRWRSPPAAARPAVRAWADPAASPDDGAGQARAAPHHAAVAVRLAGLGPEADAARVRLRAQPGGLRAAAEAGARVLHDAAAGGRAARRAGWTRRASGSTLIARKLTLDKPAAAEPMARHWPRPRPGSAATASSSSRSSRRSWSSGCRTR